MCASVWNRADSLADGLTKSHGTTVREHAGVRCALRAQAAEFYAVLGHTFVSDQSEDG